MNEMDKFEEILLKFPGLNRDRLIPVLQEIQAEFGYLPEDVIKRLGIALGLPVSKVFSLATFYNQFRFSPVGKYHIRLCHGTGCHMEGSGQLLDEIVKEIGIHDGETSRDGIFSLEILSCIGACGQAPVISVNGEYYEKVTKEKLSEIIKFYRQLEK